MSKPVLLLHWFWLRSGVWYFWLCLAIVTTQTETAEAKKPQNTPAPQAVTTYHYDTLRTGWNNNETVLTPTSLGNFNLLTSVVVDEQVDAQPLLVPAVNIPNQGTHDVLYVATENNTIYAFDATTGGPLLQQNLGPSSTSNGIAGSVR
jgi:hypothetical protein